MLLAFSLLLAVQQAPVAVCDPTAAAAPAGMAGWASPRSAKAGANRATAAALSIGTGVTATLLPTPRIAYVVPPAKLGAVASNGGLFAFDVPVAGRYRIALGSAAWVDVLRGTTPVTSLAHGHGPRCSGIRKMVDFDLRAGRHLLQVAGSDVATLPLMVSRLP